MGLLQEFREFAMKGNVVDLAVGVIIGGAFGKIVSSLVSDVIMPPIGLLLGGVNFTALKWVLKPATVDAAGKAVDAVTLNYGNFLQSAVDFLIVAFTVFLFIKGINSLRNLRSRTDDEQAAAAPPPPPPAEEVLLTEIRDILKSQTTAKPNS